MQKFKYIIINLFFINIFSNNLINVDFKKSNLSDEFSLKFEKDSLLIFYKENILNNNIKEVVFLIPNINIRDLNKLLKSINNLSNSYKFNFEICKIPLNGIKVILNYNFKNLNLEYGHLKDNAKIFFRLHKKDVLNLINQKTETFRWYAKSRDYLSQFIYV